MVVPFWSQVGAATLPPRKRSCSTSEEASSKGALGVCSFGLVYGARGISTIRATEFYCGIIAGTAGPGWGNAGKSAAGTDAPGSGIESAALA